MNLSAAGKIKKIIGKIVIFLFFAQNIDYGYTLETLTEAVLTSAYNLCFGAIINEIRMTNIKLGSFKIGMGHTAVSAP